MNRYGVAGFIVVSILAALIAPCGPASSQTTSPAWAVGMVRADGFMIPFAVYTVAGWNMPWPPVTIVTDQPDTLTVADIPPAWLSPLTRFPADWVVHLIDQADARQTVTSAVRIDSWCARQWGLPIIPASGDTTSASALSSPPMIGFAVSGDVRIAPVTRHDPEDSDLARQLRPFITKIFSDEETLLHHLVPEDQRESIPIEFTVLAEGPAGTGGDRIFYVEAVRRYDEHSVLQSRSAYSTTRFGGWVQRRGSGAFELVSHRFGMAAFDVYGPVSVETPLGVIMTDTDAFWVMNRRTYRGDLFTIRRVAPGLIENTVTVDGGECFP